MKEVPETRYELDELVEPNDLTELIESFAKALSVAAGIVRHPKPNEYPPTDIEEFKKWRLTPVIGFDRSDNRIEGGSKFCVNVRNLSGGNKRCMISDMTNANTAFYNKEAEHYYCFSEHLVDMVAAIRIGGHHLANVYFGQLRGQESSIERSWSLYQDIKRESNNAECGINREEDFLELYNQLRTVEDTVGVNQMTDLLHKFSDLISRKASREAVVRLIDEIGKEIVSTFDLRQGLEIILRKIGRAICFDSGCIWIARGKKLEPYATLYPLELQRETIEIDSKLGVAPHIFREGNTILCNNRVEMKKIKAPAIKKSRVKRDLKSFIGTPLILDGKVVGVIDLSSSRENV